VNTFFVVVQLGSILAVVVLFFRKLNPLDTHKKTSEQRETWILWSKIVVASIPTAIAGFLLDDFMDSFYSPIVVAAMLILYGIMFLVIENKKTPPRVTSLSQITYMEALAIGGFQSLALIPGTSRSGATIVGSVLMGTSRTIAAEFSFFLAIPAMAGASALKLLKSGFGFTAAEWLVLGVGSLVAFLVSLFAIKFLLDYIKKHDFKVFGYYRIILGIIVLLYFLF
jgi:undecaprenyl-diphosphatase